MKASSRRQFLESLTYGMLAAGVGPSLCQDLGLRSAAADDAAAELSFGKYDALVDLLQSTPAERLQPLLIAQLKRGEVDLPTLIAAGSLANAETFGGEDYVGFHTAMAMIPALQMTREMPSERSALPVLKVLYRNTQQIQQLGGASRKTLRALHAAEEATVENAGLAIRDACRAVDVDAAEQHFASLGDGELDDAFHVLQPVMQDDVNVHRFVFAFRTHGLAQMLGQEYAHALLRQCVRFCANHEASRLKHNQPPSPIRELMPRLLDEHRLMGRNFGDVDPGDGEVAALAEVIYQGPPSRSAAAVAEALRQGFSREVVGEAISLASNLLVLRQGPDQWRTHGDSPGVHSSDATNAWRNMARIARPEHAVTGLILAGYHVAIHKPFTGEAYPTAEQLRAVQVTNPGDLLAEAEDAIRHNDQGRAAAAIARYGETGQDADPVYDLMLRYTVSEDGRLHGEKYYQTVREEFATTRQAFRWRQLVGLARVTASAFGYDREDKHGRRAPGYEEACRLLGVTA